MAKISLPNAIITEINKWILKFPAGNKRSAIIAALTIVQKYNNGWLSKELLDAVATYLEIPKIEVYEIATFYNKFELKPVGKYKICVCTNLTCMLCDCKKIIDHLKTKLQIDFDEITQDGKFSLKELACAAVCDKAPVLEINGKQFYNLTVEKIDLILEDLE